MLPKKQGLYSPEFEHDNCGAGFICSLKGEKTNNIIPKALNILTCLEHRGAVSSDGKTGDGAGIMLEVSNSFFTSFESSSARRLTAPNASLCLFNL